MAHTPACLWGLLQVWILSRTDLSNGSSRRLTACPNHEAARCDTRGGGRRRRDDQGSLVREKPGPTPWTEPGAAPNARCWWRLAACRSACRSPGPTATAPNCSEQRSKASPSPAPGPSKPTRSTSAWTKAMTSRRRARSGGRMASWSAAFPHAGAKKPTATWTRFASFAASPPTVPPYFSDLWNPPGAQAGPQQPEATTTVNSPARSRSSRARACSPHSSLRRWPTTTPPTPGSRTAARAGGRHWPVA